MAARWAWPMLAVAACSGKAERVVQTRAPSFAQLPAEAGRFAPAHTTIAPGGRVDGAHLSDVEDCAGCHPDVAAQWESSAHAFASFNNPIYRASIDRFRAAVGERASNFCAGCHDVALLADDAMEQAIAPDDPRGHAGITCRVCHGIDEVRVDGNGSYRIASRPIPVPTSDPASIERHKRAAGRGELGVALCASCHRSFVSDATGNGVHLQGMDDASAWRNSPYSGNGMARVDDPVEKRDCLGCHMPPEPATRGDDAATDGMVASHRFLGGHLWLQDMLGEHEARVRIEARLAEAVSIDIAAARSGGIWTIPADRAPVEAGTPLELDVVIRNLGVGHRFPGGVLDAADTWIEVEVRDGRGDLVASSGTAHASDPDDRGAHVLRALVAGDDGVPRRLREVHELRALIANHTIAPRDAAAVRYRLDVPEAISLPLEVRARLRFRTRNLALQHDACRAARTGQGPAFDAGSRAVRGRALDPCAPQPIAEIGVARAQLGGGGMVASPMPPWRRAYERGLALSHDLQERLGDARHSLQVALTQAEQPAHQAQILTALGRVAGRQGRTDEALALLDRAAAIAGDHPAIDAARGDALALVWRWDEARAPYLRVTRAAPDNSRAWANLAITLGSLGWRGEALEAARRGLALDPRDADLLRVQATSLAALNAPADVAEAALDAYDRHRHPDRGNDIRIVCAQRVPGCARDREPVPVLVLEPAR